MSARALRDVTDVWGEDEPWPIDLTAYATKPAKAANSFARMAAVPFALIVLVVVWLAPTAAVTGPVRTYLPSSDRLQGVITRTFPSLQTHRFRDDFRSGLGEWLGGHGADAATAGWAVQAGTVRPGQLRLWSRSMQMSDYQFEFEGAIDRKAMAWAFRAQDHGNYYAAKIAAASSASATDAHVVRLVMQHGAPVERIQLPCPIAILEHTPYRVRVSVKGNRFSTLVNDQLVDSWTDSRFAAGGVGFFADAGELASVRWVSISDSDGILDRFFATYLLVTPARLPLRP